MIRKTLLLLTILYPQFSQAKDIIPTPADTPILGELEPVLIDRMLKQGDKESSLAKIHTDPELSALIKKHKLTLFGGPVLGELAPTSVTIWLRTPAPTTVQAIATSPEGTTIKSEKIQTTANIDLTAKIPLKNLKPDTSYSYNILINDSPHFSTDQQPTLRTTVKPDHPTKFSIAFGGGARVNPKKEIIWDTIAKSNPLAFLFLGDNVYIDDPENRSRQRLYYYRRQLRPEYQRLMSQTAAYAVFDDHDFGANDSEGGPDPAKPTWRRPVIQVFKENWPNPAFGQEPDWPGCWFDFSVGDVDFFMLDNRSYRHFKKIKDSAKRQMLGDVQKKWLLDRLKNSKATFRVLASGTLWTEHADKGGADSWWGAPHERDEIFDFLKEHQIEGTILISADRHRTDIYKIERQDAYPLYEFETSKLTNDHTHGTKKEALFSYNEGNFFGLLTFDTTIKDPTITFKCIRSEGHTVHTHTLKRSELK